MKSLIKFTLLTGFLFHNSQLLAQETVNKGDIIIHISTLAPSVSLGNDFMDIYKRGTNAEIVYRKYKNTVYDTTKVIVDLNIDMAYNKTLQLLTQSSKQALETSIVGERHYLDGFSFSCEIITDTGTKNIYIHTPMPDTHPIVSSLLDESYKRLFKKNYPY